MILLCLSPLAVQTALAQTEEIVVVGSRGDGRNALDSPVPVDVITADDIERVATFGGELGELLQALAPSFNFPRQSNSGSADHIRATQLRGMSPDQVLVLVNGKRQHTAAVVNLESKIGLGSNPFDFNTIPLISIKRIEILRDGASVILSGNWSYDRWSVLLRTTRFGKTTRDFDFGGGLPDPQVYDSNWSVDLEAAFDVTDSWTVAIGADNVLDEYPDQSNDNNNFFGHLPFDVLPPIGMNGAYWYARTRVTF